MYYDPLAIHNEQVKLLATTLATIGIAIMMLAVVNPIFDGEKAFSFWLLPVGFVIWSVSAYVLTYLKK